MENNLSSYGLFGHPGSTTFSAATSKPLKHADIGHGRRTNRLPDGTYHIVNVSTGTYAALLNDDERSEVVNVTLGLNEKADLGSIVITLLPSSIIEKSYMGFMKWLINHLANDDYKLQNVEFGSFVSHDSSPQVEDPVLGKADAIAWTIRLVQSPNMCR